MVKYLALMNLAIAVSLLTLQSACMVTSCWIISFYFKEWIFIISDFILGCLDPLFTGSDLSWNQHIDKITA